MAPWVMNARAARSTAWGTDAGAAGWAAAMTAAVALTAKTLRRANSRLTFTAAPLQHPKGGRNGSMRPGGRGYRGSVARKA